MVILLKYRFRIKIRAISYPYVPLLTIRSQGTCTHDSTFNVYTMKSVTIITPLINHHHFLFFCPEKVNLEGFLFDAWLAFPSAATASNFLLDTRLKIISY